MFYFLSTVSLDYELCFQKSSGNFQRTLGLTSGRPILLFMSRQGDRDKRAFGGGHKPKNGADSGHRREAKKMVGKTPSHIVATRPLVDGVVSDFEVTEQMLRYFIEKVHQGSSVFFPRPQVVIGIPSGVTEVEKRAVVDAAVSAGARKAYLVDEPMAAAIGARLPVQEASGNMIVDIGGGTTEIAVISLGGVVVCRSLRIAGDEMNEDIIRYARDEFNLLLGRKNSRRHQDRYRERL